MKYVVTIATGIDYYVRLAENLAISFLYWNKNTDVQFVILTDQPGIVDEKLRPLIRVIDISGTGDTGFISKFSITKFLQEGKVLFLDTDCIIYGDVNRFFDRYSHEKFLAFGKNHTEGDGIGYCRDIKKLREEQSIDFFPIVTGSLYYYSDFGLAEKIISFARDHADVYDQMGFIRLRNKANEEPLIGVGMAKQGVRAMPDDGVTKGDIMFFDKLRTDVIHGKARLWNVKYPKKPFVTDLMEANPLVVHFDGINTQFYPYKSEIKMLRNWFFKSKSPANARASVLLSYKYPNQVVEKFKDVFRPLYHITFGPNKVKDSAR